MLKFLTPLSNSLAKSQTSAGNSRATLIRCSQLVIDQFGHGDDEDRVGEKELTFIGISATSRPLLSSRACKVTTSPSNHIDHDPIC